MKLTLTESIGATNLYIVPCHCSGEGGLSRSVKANE